MTNEHLTNSPQIGKPATASDHTAWPWEWDEESGALYAKSDLERLRAERAAENYEFWPNAIVETDMGQYGPRGLDRLLIAAAPDMLAALKAVEEWWLTTQMHSEIGAPYAIFATRAAIAKATEGKK